MKRIALVLLGLAMIFPMNVRAQNKPDQPNLVERVAALENLVQQLKAQLLNADLLLQEALKTELNNRTQADLLLQEALNTEVNNRFNKDAELLKSLTRAEYDIERLFSKVLDLEARPCLGKPDYDSLWFNPQEGRTYLQHNLGTHNLLVYMYGRHPGTGIHQIQIGGDLNYPTNEGATWLIENPNELVFIRYPDDTRWSSVRVLIWKIPY